MSTLFSHDDPAPATDPAPTAPAQHPEVFAITNVTPSDDSSLALPEEKTKLTTSKLLSTRATFTTVPIDELLPDPDQPRKTFNEDDLQELADNYSVNGMLQPITVRVAPGGQKIIMFGERRWRAAKIAKWSEVPCIVRTGVPDSAILAAQLAENSFQRGVNKMEEARAIAEYMRINKIATQDAAAKALGHSLPWVSQRLACLNLDEDDQQRVAEGTLSLVEGARLGRRMAGVTRDRKPRIPQPHAMAAARTAPGRLAPGAGLPGGYARTADASGPPSPANTAPADILATNSPAPTSATEAKPVPTPRLKPLPATGSVVEDEGPYAVAEWFSEDHPLAARARGRCQLRHQRRKTVPGGVACAECWETAIRRDERLHPTEG